MANLGVFCLPMASHMQLFLALGETMKARGHAITFFGIPEVGERVRDAGFSFEVIEPDGVPPGTLGEMMRQMSTLGRLQAMQVQGRFDNLRYEAILKKAPELIKRARIDGMIVDQAEACGGSVAEAGGLPWVNVANGLHLNSEPGVPPFFTSWEYSAGEWAKWRNRAAYLGIGIAASSIKRLVNHYRQQWGLQPQRGLDDTFSPFAQISQQVREFDFPREALPRCFHYTGPLRGKHRKSVDFPFERLNGKRLIYSSLGTVVNGQDRLYRCIAEACADLDAQLVISLGGARKTSEYDELPGSPVVVQYAPQVELIGRAALTVTHAGLNTTLESLAKGVPMVAIPITFEQPAIAARIRWTGTGEFIPAGKVTARRLRTVISNVLENDAYHQAAQRMKQAIAESGGNEKAAWIIEQVLRTGRPVTAAAFEKAPISNDL